MISSVNLKHHKNQMMLAFDCLTPDEAHKIMDCLFQEDMDEMLSFCYNIELCYGVTGYRIENDKKVWSHDLVLFIETDEAMNESLVGKTVREQLKEDEEFLESIRTIVKNRTGIQDEEIEDEEEEG